MSTVIATCRRGREVLLLVPVLLAGLTLFGCSAPPYQDLPTGGVDTTAGPLVVDDMWIDAPQGVAAGSTAPLRLTLDNNSDTSDELIQVSTPVAQRVVLEQAGKPVSSLQIPAGAWIDKEWKTSIEVENFREAIPPGRYFPVTLTFRRAGALTTQIIAGPLGAPQTGSIIQTPRHQAPIAAPSPKTHASVSTKSGKAIRWVLTSASRLHSPWP